MELHHKSLTPPKEGLSLNQTVLFTSAAGECTPVLVVKQPVTLESFGHREALKMLLLSDKLWLIISVALLILLQAFKMRVIYIINLL